MSFNYSKHKEGGGAGDTFWTSYSDLFLGLSTIFLLLYVTASLRTGTDGLKNQLENQKLTMKVQDLQNQLKMYETVKKDYLQNEASKDEVQEYTELMDKLTLLQEEAKDEKTRLQQQALENDMKEKALNKYQQMVRNVINANKLAKTKITKRNDIIEEQDQEIEDQDQEITQLEKDIQQKQNLIAKNEKEIEEANQNLEKKMKELKQAFKQNRMTAQSYQKKLAQMKEDSENKIDSLRDAQEAYEKQLKQTQSQLGSLTGQLNQTQAQLSAKESEAKNLENKLGEVEGENQKRIAALKGEFEAQKARDRAAFENELKKHQMGAAERAAKEKAYRDAAAQKEKDLASKIAGLSGQVSGLSDRLKNTEGQLAQARAEKDARREVAQEIKKGFAKAGIKGDVDLETGEVLLDFGQAYFENDSAKLKLEMKSILEKAMPIYSKSLFGNPKVAKKISAVEVVGFASPTYQGKFVDPSSNRPKDREAIKYNMDLSYRRAKSIFNHILDEKSMQFEYQKDLLPMMKVSGRSFLEVLKVNRNVASEDFCKVNDCKKAQRVIIRFGMDGKK